MLFSQGAALCHRAIENLSTSVKARIAGVVTFGDTQNLQDRGQIPNFPREKVRIFCNTGDLVCVGTLTITAAHLTYGSDAPAAVAFLASRIRAS
jgi:cutinase